jgi:anti-anti-sigma factor
MTGDQPGRPPVSPARPDGPPPAGPPASTAPPAGPVSTAPPADAVRTALPADADPSAPPAADAPLLDQVFDADSLYALRAAVAAHASAAGLSPARADDLVIAVHELAANAIRHGAGHGRLRVRRAGQTLLCEISDDGAPPPAGDGAPPPPDAAHWPTEPGHGLSLVRQVADHTTLVSGADGTLATIAFALGPAPTAFRLDHQQLDGCTVVAVIGQLEESSARQLAETIDAALAETPDLALVLDLASLTGWDSVGLAALISAQQRISASPPARMVLAGLPDHLSRSLAESGLAASFLLAATAAAAVPLLR